MAANAQRMNDLLALSHVPRWGIVRTTHPQSVADHSYRVAVIALELYHRLMDAVSTDEAVQQANYYIYRLNLGDILLWALVHDGGESHTGDIPGHIKFNSPELTTAIHHTEQQRCPWLTAVQPSPYIKCLVKIADFIESATFMWMNKHGSYANWVWRYMDGRLTDAVNGCCAELGLSGDQLWPIVGRLVSDIQTEEGRLRP